MNPSKSTYFFRPAPNAALIASALWLCAVSASAQSADPSGSLGLRPSQSGGAHAASPTPEADSTDWSALNWDVSKLSVSGANSLQAPAASKPGLSWDRTDKRDGSAAVTVKKALPTAWDSKVGVDMNLADQPANTGAPIDPDKLLPGAAANSSTGAAWASVTAPALNIPAGWDKATIDARFDPSHEQRKIGATVSKSVPLNERFSVTLQNGTSMTQAPATTSSSPSAIPGTLAATQQPAPYGPTHYFSSDNSAKLNVLPTGTSLSVGTAMSSTDEKWRRSIGAEQKLFDGISIKGAVSETTTGIPDKSISAGFKRNW